MWFASIGTTTRLSAAAGTPAENTALRVESACRAPGRLMKKSASLQRSPYATITTYRLIVPFSAFSSACQPQSATEALIKAGCVSGGNAACRANF
jgi:hypothetical protein